MLFIDQPYGTKAIFETPWIVDSGYSGAYWMQR